MKLCHSASNRVLRSGTVLRFVSNRAFVED